METLHTEEAPGPDLTRPFWVRRLGGGSLHQRVREAWGVLGRVLSQNVVHDRLQDTWDPDGQAVGGRAMGVISGCWRFGGTPLRGVGWCFMSFRRCLGPQQELGPAERGSC